MSLPSSWNLKRSQFRKLVGNGPIMLTISNRNLIQLIIGKPLTKVFKSSSILAFFAAQFRKPSINYSPRKTFIAPNDPAWKITGVPSKIRYLAPLTSQNSNGKKQNCKKRNRWKSTLLVSTGVYWCHYCYLLSWLVPLLYLVLASFHYLLS